MRWFLTVFMPVTLMTLGTSGRGFAQQQASSNNQQQVTAGTQQQAVQTGADAAAMYGMATGDERFLRENREAGQMVGTPVTGVGATRGTASATNQGGRAAGGQNPFGRLGNMFGNQFGNQFRSMMGGRYNTRQQLRIPVRLGFTATARPEPSAISGRVQNRLQRIPGVRKMGAVSVEMDGSTAVLRGQVSTEHDRELVSRLLLFEPGISDVRDELQVASTAVELP